MERTAIFPGSFDPFTRGHAALVDEALNLFDRVIIGIGNNTSKQGLLTVENRKRLIDDIYRGDERVEACIYTGLTGEFAEAAGACAIIRGVRNTTDFEYERTMEATNHRIYPDITTVMLFRRCYRSGSIWFTKSSAACARAFSSAACPTETGRG